MINILAIIAHSYAAKPHILWGQNLVLLRVMHGSCPNINDSSLRYNWTDHLNRPVKKLQDIYTLC